MALEAAHSAAPARAAMAKIIGEGFDQIAQMAVPFRCWLRRIQLLTADTLSTLDMHGT
jgi:hypothetical protein